MERVSRRHFIGAAGALAATGLAGCTEVIGAYLGNDEEGEFLVVSTNLLHAPGYRWEEAEYPDDIVGRVAVENRRPNRQQATLVTVLRHEPPDGEPEQWEDRRQLNEGRGVSPTLTIIFHDVWDEGDNLDNFEISAEIVEPGENTVNETG